LDIFGGYVIRVFACLAPLVSNFYAASGHLSFSVLCVHLPSCWSCSNSRVRRWRTSPLGWVIRRFHTALWYRRWVGSLSFSFFFFFVSGFLLQCMRWSFEARVGLNGALFCSSSSASGACGKLPPHCVADDEEERYCWVAKCEWSS
jgi:hypothetical protein